MAAIGGCNESIDDIVTRNRYGIRSLEAKYLQ